MLKRKTSRSARLPALLAAVAGLTLGACRGDNYHPGGGDGGGDDALADTGYDAHTDSGADGDVDVDTDVDVDSDADSDIPGCQYPGGPYGFERFATVGPMRWPSAVTGRDTTGEADLSTFFCDEEVHSVFIQVTTTV